MPSLARDAGEAWEVLFLAKERTAPVKYLMWAPGRVLADADPHRANLSHRGRSSRVETIQQMSTPVNLQQCRAARFRACRF